MKHSPKPQISYKQAMRNPKLFIPFVLGSLTIQCMGVVFGDIGTSPLYALNVTFSLLGENITSQDVIGVVSTIFWALFIVILIWYTRFMMETGHKNEGGITAIKTLLREAAKNFTRHIPEFIFFFGILGVSAMIADGMITPAISVLSAIEGLKTIFPGLNVWVIVGITIGILLALFSIQKQGTGFVGQLFGPVMCLWFGTLGVLGIRGILHAPEILQAVFPWHAVAFILHHPILGGPLAGIVLVITGGEALFADMGHFGKEPIRKAWAYYVMPALVLNYMGQGAMVLHDPVHAGNTFFSVVPPFLYIPMIILSTSATIIASQALITGVFSLVKALSQKLDLIPLLVVKSTSQTHSGQIYYSLVNWILCIGALSMVLFAHESEHLASMYGFTVLTAMLAEIILKTAHEYYIKSRNSKVRFFLWSLVYLFMAGVLALFLVANIQKILQGGWIPATMAVIITGLMILFSLHKRRLLQLKKDSLTQDPLPKEEPASSYNEVTPGCYEPLIDQRLVLVLLDDPPHMGSRRSIIEAMVAPHTEVIALHISCEENVDHLYQLLSSDHINPDRMSILCEESGDVTAKIVWFVREKLRTYDTIHVIRSETYTHGKRPPFHGMNGTKIEEELKKIPGIIITVVPFDMSSTKPHHSNGNGKLALNGTRDEASLCSF